MFLLNATKSCLTLVAGELLVAGSVNVHEVKFEFSDDWSDLVKTVTFRTVSDSRSVILNDEGECVIPWEVLKDSSPYLYVGLIGTRDAEVVLPTIWADLGEVRNGTKPGADVTDPTPTVYEQVLSELGSRANNLNVKNKKLQLRSGETVLSEVELPKQEEPGTTDHAKLTNRDAADQHPIEAITGLAEALKEAGSGGGVTAEEVDEKIAEAIEAIPNPSWNDLTDKPFGEEVAEGVVLAETEFDFNYEAQYMITEPLELIAGTSYTVKWKDKVYECVAIAVEEGGLDVTLMGDVDSAMTGGAAENPPFYFMTFSPELTAQIGAYALVVNDYTSEYVKCSIVSKTTTVKTLDEQYLPTTVPVIQTAQIGQTIVVKAVDENGKPTEWEAADLGGAAIIDVVELPTENIEEDSFYRLLSGSLVFNQYVQNAYTVHCVNELPEVGEPATNLDQTDGNVYYNVQDGSLNGYVDATLSAALSVPEGWYPAGTLLQALGFSYSGVITDILDDHKDSSFRLLLEYVLWQYKNGKWTSMKSIGWNGDGAGAEVFNHPSNKATSFASHAEGCETTASGDFSHAEGYGTTASGEFSHAEGYGTTASGNRSHAEGCETTASGDRSHAEGYGTTASGLCSHAEGDRTIAAGLKQHAQGKYNIEDTENKYAHIVGNGEGQQPNGTVLRSNAHTLDWYGLGWFAGGLKVGGTGQDDEASRTVMVNGDAQIVLTSPNGTKFAITVSDDGTLTATAQ